MHLSHTLDVVEDFDFEELHIIIANILHVVLVDTLVLSPRAFPQLKP